MNLVFGPKFNKEFPRKYLESKTCGDGFWESTGKNHYEHTGVDIETEIGSQVMPDSQKKKSYFSTVLFSSMVSGWVGGQTAIKTNLDHAVSQ